MALRRQNLSPTANLLRNSRLFSLPNPLPRPPVTTNTVGSHVSKASDTATLPFPTHQAIATTPKSLARGDWGLKRPLPSRSHIVQTSNPVVKVKQLDTIEHITDFDSAADHVRTRQKFEELSVPLLKGMAAMRNHGPGAVAGGAFEHRSDITSYDKAEGLDEAGLTLEAIKKSALENSRSKRGKDGAFTPFSLPQPDATRHNIRRWKHEGPWLPGMSAEEFTRYMNKELSKRKDEFQLYLRHYVKSSIFTARHKAWRDAQVLPEDPQDADAYLARQEDEAYLAEQAKEWAKISEKDISAGIRALRNEAAVNPLQSRLVQRLIVPFLRVPTIKLKDQTWNPNSRTDFAQYRFDDDVAPLSTHPSAGLGYLRTNAYMSNHPILGPQSERTPVKARIIEPRSVNKETTARLGVAGFVTNDMQHGIGERSKMMAGRDPAAEIDINTEGGAKLNVIPQYASVTNDGRIHIKTTRSFGAEVMVANGELEDKPPQRQPSKKDSLRDLSPARSGTELDAQSPEMQQFLNLTGVAKPSAATSEEQSTLRPTSVNESQPRSR